MTVRIFVQSFCYNDAINQGGKQNETGIHESGKLREGC